MQGRLCNFRCQLRLYHIDCNCRLREILRADIEQETLLHWRTSIGLLIHFDSNIPGYVQDMAAL